MKNALTQLIDALDKIFETDEELLISDVSDDALERVASIGVGLSVVSLNFGTSIVGNCACPDRRTVMNRRVERVSVKIER